MRLGYLRRADKEGAEQRAAGAADVGKQRHPGIFEDKTDVLIGNRRQLFHHLTEAAMHVQAVVGVADLFIQPGKKIPLFGKDLAAAIEPVNDLRSVQ